MVDKGIAESPVELLATTGGCEGINATSDVFFDEGALYDVVVVVLVPTPLSLIGEDVADVLALCVFNSNRGCGFEVPVAGVVGDRGDCEVREYPVALPSSEGRLGDCPVVGGLGTLEGEAEGSAAALPDEIVARRGWRFDGRGGSLGAISDVVLAGSVLMTVWEDPYIGMLLRGFNVPANGISSSS